MMQNMQSMMSGMADSMFFWIALITLICLLIIGMLAWLVARWLNKQKTATTQYVPQPRDAFDILPMPEGRGFPLSRARVPASTSLACASFRPSRSYSLSAG